MTLIQFDEPSGRRIGQAVRYVEDIANRRKPLSFDAVLESRDKAKKVFRIATFTGVWVTGSTNTVTLKHQTATPNTVSAVNLFFPITTAPSGARDCAIAKEGTAWYLIDVPLRTATSIFVTATATALCVTDISVSAALNTASCSISIGRSLTTTSLTIIKTTMTASYLSLDL